LNFVKDPVLEGTATGTLKLTFANPTTKLSFGAALNVFDQIDTAVNVQLFDSSKTSLGTFHVDTHPAAVFSEGEFNYEGKGVAEAVLTFSNPTPPVRFALDNLVYNTATIPDDGVNEVPEPASLTLLFTGSALLLLRARRAFRGRTTAPVT
jgi:hypothetical protein